MGSVQFVSEPRTLPSAEVPQQEQLYLSSPNNGRIIDMIMLT
jgi:hypothetical protein